MFEAHVLYLLRRYLGEYVRGLSVEALQISVWKGDVVLKDLQLKAEALNALKLPITVKAGFLGSVTLRVPWSKLGKEPVIVLIDRVFVLAEPIKDELSDTKENKEKWMEAKRRQLEELELALLEAKDKGISTSTEGNSWIGSIVATIIGNLKISVTNLHIRYEDPLSNPSHPLCFGITLAKLAAVTIDDNDVETFVTSSALDRLHKSLQLENFAVYHDTDTQPWVVEKSWEQLSPKEWSEMFEPSIQNQSGLKTRHQYLLHPVAAMMKYHRCGKREKRDPDVPFQKASLVFDQVSLTVSQAQYRDGMKLLEEVSRYRTRMEFSHYRPQVSCREDPRAWWIYAVQAALQQKRKSRYKCSWETISRLCQLRRKYVQLYANGLQQGKADSPEIRQVDEQLNVEVVLLWRLLAHAKVESAKLKEAARAREHARKSSWWNLGWTGPATNQVSGPSLELKPESGPSQFTKEEWNKINELVSFQPGQDAPVQEAPNMLQVALEITLKQSEASIIDANGSVLLCGTFSNLQAGAKIYPKSLHCDSKLTYYGLSAPEGPLIESFSREGRNHALALTFVHHPLEEHLDWKLSVTMSPCHVTVWRSSFDRFVEFLKSGQALSPNVALETAAALQNKLEEVTRRAQEQLQLALKEKKRFFVDLDIDAPKVRIPAVKRVEGNRATQLLLDLGHFHLRTAAESEAVDNLYSRFHVSGRDISAFFVDGDFEWSDFPNLVAPVNIPSEGGVAKGGYRTGESSYYIFPVLERCGMSVVLDQIRMEHPKYPSTRVAIEVPRLGLHFSPARYLRMLHLLHAVETAKERHELSLPRQVPDYAGQARVLTWGGIGNIVAEWQSCWIQLIGPYLYILETEDALTYLRCCGMSNKQVVEIPPEFIGGSDFVIAVCSRGADLQKVVESSNAAVIQLANEEVKSSWLTHLTSSTYRASAPLALVPDDLTSEESSSRTVNASNSLNLFVSGALQELQISLSGKTILGKNSSDEFVIVELQASGGKVNLLQQPYDLTIAIKLHSFKIEDKLQGAMSTKCQYIARSVLSTSLTDSGLPHDSSSTDSGLPHDVDTASSLTEVFIDDDYEDALPEFSASEHRAQKNMRAWEPDRLSKVDVGTLLEELFATAEGEEASDFVRVRIVMRQSDSQDYGDTDTQINMDMATLDFFCNRITVVALIEFGMQISEIIESEYEASNEDETGGERHIVTGLLGRGKSRIIFRLKMEMESARIFLNMEDGSQLAMLAQEKFQMDLKVFPGSFTIAGTLGNLRVCDTSLGPEHRWGWLCDIRDQTCGSLVEFEFQSFHKDDDDFQGYDYSLIGRLSAVRIVFLYRFVQEVTTYFLALATPQTQQIITVVDKSGGIERLIQKADMDGSPALKLDVSMDTPIIVMPRSSNSKEFMEVDLGHLKLSNSFEWHGGEKDNAAAVHLDVMSAEISGIDMVVGIDGRAGKSMIQEARGLHVTIRRPLRDLFKKVPEVQVDVQVETFRGVMSDREYLVIIDCAATNVAEIPKLPANFRDVTPSESDDQDTSFKSVNLEDMAPDPQEYWTKVWVLVDIQYAELELFKGLERESPLARVEVHGFWLGYRSSSTLEADVYVTLPKLSIVDLRPGTKPEMRMMFGSMADAEKCDTCTEPAHSKLTMLVMDLRLKPDSQAVVIRMQRPRLLVVVDFLLEVGEFFVPSLVAQDGVNGGKDPILMQDVRLTGPVYKQQEEILVISSSRQLIADAYDIEEFVFDGCGHVLYLKLEDDYNGLNAEPLIVVGYGKKLRFKNIRIKNGSRIHECVQLACNASYSVSRTDGVIFEEMDDDSSSRMNAAVESGSNPNTGDHVESGLDFFLDLQIVAPELTFYDSTKWPSGSFSRQERLLRAKLDFNLMLQLKGNNKWVRSFLKGLSVENSAGIVIVNPLDISAEYACAQDKANILVTASDIFMRPSFNVVRLVLRLHDDAMSKFQFGTGLICRCTHFDRIWVNNSGNNSAPQIAFWRPRSPPGFVILCDCATSGPAPPSQGVVAVFNAHHRVKKPTRFDMVWHSFGESLSEDATCCAWLPIAPPGYMAMGCVVERGTSPPPLSTVYCVRADLVTSSAVNDCIFYIPPGDRDHANGCSIWRAGNAVGSFFALSSVKPPPNSTVYDLREALLRHLGAAVTEKTDGDFEVKVAPGRKLTADSRSISRFDQQCHNKAGRASLTTPQFERLWWDKGTETRRVVSIWRPVPAAGYVIVGDTIVDGLEPPGVGLVMRDDGSGRLAKPVRFQQRLHICGRGLEDVFIWFPVAPTGYASLGCVATKTEDSPSLDMLRCVRMDLVNQGNLSRRPVWSYLGSRVGNSCCLWRVENQAHTFIARADMKRPPARMAFSLAETGKPTLRENLSAEMKVGRFSVTLFDDLTGLTTPLLNMTMTGINLAAHGRPDALNAVALTSIAASTFNTHLEAWEPLLEPFDGILKYEFYDGDSESTTLKVGRRVRITAANTVNVNITSAGLESLLSASREWVKQTESEQQALSALQKEETDYKESSVGKAALEEDDTEKLVLQNNLYCELYIRTFNSDFEDVEVLREGQSCTVALPPPKFPDRTSNGYQRKEGRQFVAVQVLGAQDLPVNDDGNCPDFLCALRLVTVKQSPDEQKALPQSARSRCVRPSSDSSGCRADWNEIFIFEVPSQGSANLEVVVTNQAARSGKGEAVGILSLPVKEEAGQRVFRPSSLWKIVRQSINQETLPHSQAKSFALKPPRRKTMERSCAEVRKGCGTVLLNLYFFTTSEWRPEEKSTDVNGKDFGLLIARGQDGPWESLRSVLPVAIFPKTVSEQQLAVEVTMNQGRKKAVFRSLAVIFNNTDLPLEVAVCPYALLNSSDDASGAPGSSNQVAEECFENQRYQPLAGWGSKWPGHLIPTDPGRWSTRDYSESSQEILQIPLPPGWIWSSEWRIDKSGNVDSDGWFYGSDFQSLKSLPVSSKASKKSTFDFTRRRRWVRIRRRVPDSVGLKRDILSVISPGSSLPMPLASMAHQADICAQVRPASDSGKYMWGRIVVDPNQSLKGSESTPSTPRKSRPSKPNQSAFSFTLSQLEKTEQLLLCLATDSAKGHCWLNMEADADIVYSDLNTPVCDWKLSVNAPLRLENLLPCNAEYIIWEKVNDARPVKRQHGIVSSGESIYVYAVDVRRPIFLTLLPQGGWRPEKEGVLISDPKSDELPLGFWMVHQESGRKLRVSLEYDFGSSYLAAKLVRLFVPYWLCNDAALPLSYRLVELDYNCESPKGPKAGKLPRDGKNKAKLHKTVRVLETVESSIGSTVMLSPHAQPERLGPLNNSQREDVLSPRIGLAVALTGSDLFKYGFSIRDLEECTDHVNLNAFDGHSGYYKLSISLNLSSERTKIIHIQPHSMFVNRIGCRLQLCHSEWQQEEFLYPNDAPRTFLWHCSQWEEASHRSDTSTQQTGLSYIPVPSRPRSAQDPELLRIRLDGYKWSQAFSVDSLGTMHIKLRSETGTGELFVRTEVRSGTKGSSQLVIFRYTSIHGPYRLENRSLLAIVFRQEGGNEDSWQTLRPGTAITFAWENLSMARIMEIYVQGGDPKLTTKFKIDEPASYQPMSTNSGIVAALHVTVTREGFTQVVQINNWVSDSENSALVTVTSPRVPAESSKRPKSNPSENVFHASIELAELGLSVVDHTPEELLYMSVQNFFLSYSTGLGSEISRLKLHVDGLQVDNQLSLTPMPVLFSPQDTAKQAEYLFKCTITVKDNGLSDQLEYPYVGIQGPNVPNVAFLVNIHEPIIWRLHEMFRRLDFDQLRSSQTTAVALDPIIHIGLLNTSEIRFKVTLAMSPTQRPRGVLGFWSTLLTSLGNTDDMPIRITPHVHEDICMSQSAMVSAAIASVRNDMLSQPLRLLSGVDLLGNASSALGHMSKGVAALSMDKKFIRSRQKQETKANVEDIGDGIREGGEALAKGFFRGVTGILTKPLEGARSSGVEGFFQGVGKGVIGAAVQPMSGILDLLSKTTEGANATRMKLAAALTSEEQLLRRRLPRVIGGDNVLRPYDEYKAQGQVLLQLAQRGTLFGPVDIFKIRSKFATSDAYEDHFNLPKARTLIITHRRVMLLQHPTGLLVQKKPDLLKNPCTVTWDVTWNELMTMELAHAKHEPKTLPPSRLIIYLRSHSQESIFDSRDTMRIVKCLPATSQASEIMSAIQRAYDTYGPERAANAAQVMETRSYGRRPYAGLRASTASSTATLGLLTGPNTLSVPMLTASAFDALLDQQDTTTTSITTPSPTAAASGDCIKGRFISDFKLIWSSKEDSISIWRPATPSGYVSVGDIAQPSHDPPDTAMVYAANSKLLPASGFELVWREEGSPPLTIWKPRADEGHVALGCIAVADYHEPDEVGMVHCVESKMVKSVPVKEISLRRSALWGCNIWRIDNNAKTFIVTIDRSQQQQQQQQHQHQQQQQQQQQQRPPSNVAYDIIVS